MKIGVEKDIVYLGKWMYRHQYFIYGPILMKCGIFANRSVGTCWFVIIGLVETMLFHSNVKAREIFIVKNALLESAYYYYFRGELRYLAPLGSENISSPYFKQCFFQVGVLPPD